jgi:hypothetical protein
MAIPIPPAALTPNQTQWLATPGPKTTVTLSWQASPGAAFYAVRVDDLTVPSLRAEGNDCGGDPHYVCRDHVTGTSAVIPVRAGHAYRWWVHAVNGEGWSGASSAGFRVGEPPLNPNFSHGALQIFPIIPPYREIVAPAPAQWRVEALLVRTPEQQAQVATFRAEVRDRNGAVLGTGMAQLPAGAAQRATFGLNVQPLPAGRYTLRVGAYTAANVLIEQEETDYDVHVNPPVVRIAENGLLRRHSVPWFPLGFYIAEQMADEDFARMASWGANCAVSYGFGFLGYFTGNEPPALAVALDFLNRARRNGMGILWNLASFYQDSADFPNPDQRNGLELAVEYMRNFKAHPALLAYYLADEPNLGGRIDRMPKILAMQQLVADYDSDHPSWVVLVNGAKPVVDFHYRIADFLAVDPYPIPGFPLEAVEQWTQGNAAGARGVRPNWTVPQMHDPGVYPQSPLEPNEPTANEKTCMAMLALTGGATGLIFYSYFDFFREVVPSPVTRDYMRQPSSPQTLARRFAEAAAVLRHVTSVMPALLAGTVRPINPSDPATPIRSRAVELGGELWVILANPTSTPLSVSYTLPAGAWSQALAPNGGVTAALPAATTLSVSVPARSGGTVRVERAGAAGTLWTHMPDTATDIGAGADGSVWIIGTTPAIGGFNIRQFNGSGWTTIDGGAVRIAAGLTGPWVVNSGGSIFRRTPSGWRHLPGGARDIGVGPADEAWIIGTNPVPGGFGIWWWDGDEWRTIEGGGVRIAVGPRGTPWIVDSAKRILRHDGVRWVQLPGAANDIAVGADGTPWIISTTVVGSGFSIQRWNGIGWNPVDGWASEITVARDGLPWVVNSLRAIYRRGR